MTGNLFIDMWSLLLGKILPLTLVIGSLGVCTHNWSSLYSGKKKTSRAAKRKLPEGIMVLAHCMEHAVIVYSVGASKETGGRGTKSPFGVDE